MATRRKRRSDGRYESSIRYEKPDGTRGRLPVYGRTNAELERQLHEKRERLLKGAPVRDSSFPGGPGRTTHPEEFNSLMNDLETKVFDRFPDDTWFYPGHGNDSTLGTERPNLSEWRERGW
jgi:hypothetical protein